MRLATISVMHSRETDFMLFQIKRTDKQIRGNDYYNWIHVSNTFTLNENVYVGQMEQLHSSSNYIVAISLFLSAAVNFRTESVALS